MLLEVQMKGICLFCFLLIPNGPAGLLVTVNEEPVHAIGILYFLSVSDSTFERLDSIGDTHTRTRF